MSANPSKDLNLNLDAVPLEDQDEISRVTVTTNVSVSETLTEGGIDQVRVSGGGEDLVESSIDGSDDRVEGNLKEVSVNEGGVDENEGERFDASVLQKVGSSEVEERKTETEVVKVECSMKIVESPVEQNQVVVEVLNPSCLEENGNFEVETVGGSTAVGVESFPNSDPRRSSMPNLDTCENITHAQDEKQEAVSKIDEVVSNQIDGDERLDSDSVEKNINSGPSVTVDADSMAEITEGVAETFRPLQDSNLDSEFQVAEACISPPCEDQNMGTGDSAGEENQPMEIDVKTEEEGGSCKQEQNQIEGSHVSEVRPIELSGNDSNKGSLVVDLNTCSDSVGNQNVADEVVKEEMCLPDEPCIEGVEVKLVGSDIDDDAANDATDVSFDENPKIEITEQDTSFEQCEDDFFVPDMVWGKVRSHPWWPGQIFDPSDSSEIAKKYQKNDRFLVAYFGDQTFAWNEASSLKPFKTHFSQMEKQANLKAFHDAVDCALDEVSRRVELGLSCSCTPDEAYAKIRTQIIKNAGIREEACRKDVVDKTLSVTSFEPVKLAEYIKALAMNPNGGGDRLELVMVQAQLAAFYRSKGYSQLPRFWVYGGLLENDAEHATPVSKAEEQEPSRKRKFRSQNSSEDALNPRRKEKRLSELMDGKSSLPYGANGVKGASKSASLSSHKKHKDIDSFSDNLAVQSRKQMLLPSRNLNSESPTPLRVGERIRRIASQLAGSPPLLKHKVDDVDVSPHTAKRSHKQRVVIPKEYSSPDELLSQLCLAARDPMKGYSFLNIIVGFFTDFRNSISLDNSSSGKKKFGGGKTDAKNKTPSNSKTSSAETCNYGNDSYWTDRIIQSSPEEQPSTNNQKRKGDSKDSPSFESKNSLELNPTIDSDCPNIEPGVDDMNGKCVGDLSPTALILNFTEADSIPSETDLNKIFSRYGSLKESETEVMRKAKRARVIFERRSDAEVAFSSAGKFSTFGPALVSYQLKYLSSAVCKASPRATAEGRKDVKSFEGNTS